MYDYDRPATQDEAHREWHRNAEVPIGPYGGSCPWDACGHAADDEYEEEARAEMGEWRDGFYYVPARWGSPVVCKNTLPAFEVVGALVVDVEDDDEAPF